MCIRLNVEMYNSVIKPLAVSLLNENLQFVGGGGGEQQRRLHSAEFADSISSAAGTDGVVLLATSVTAMIAKLEAKIGEDGGRTTTVNYHDTTETRIGEDRMMRSKSLSKRAEKCTRSVDIVGSHTDRGLTPLGRSGAIPPPRDFYIPPHPVVALLIPYGLLLTISSALFPQNIPSFFPLGDLARYLGETYPTFMKLLAIFAASLHIAEPFWAATLAYRYELLSRQMVLWILNAFFFGIFALWPLVFYDVFLENASTYCGLPLAIC